MSLFKRIPKQKTLFAHAEDTAEQEYHEILARADEPQPEDYAKVEELLPYLGITWAQAKRDFEVLKRARELNATLAKAKEADAKLVDLNARCAELDKQLADYHAKMDPVVYSAKAERAEAAGISQRQYEARAELEQLKEKYPRAFGMRKPKPETQTEGE